MQFPNSISNFQFQFNLECIKINENDRINITNMNINIINIFYYLYKLKLAAPKIVFFLPAFVTRLLTPRSRKSGYGLLLGCRSGFNGGREKKTFLMLFLLKKP